MKHSAAADQGASPGSGPRGPHSRRTQPTVKAQTLRTFKQLASKLAGFKLSRPAIADTPVRATVPGTGAPSLSTGTKSTPSEKPQIFSIPTATPSVSNAAIPGLPFIKDSKGSRIAFNLLLVRPWILVVGFWIMSLAGASLAIEGLVNPKKLQMALPEATVEVTPVASTNALIKVEQDTAETTAETTAAKSAADGNPVSNEANAQGADEAAQNAAPQTAASQTAPSSAGFPIWPMTALVGTCAASCLVISRRRAMIRLAQARSRNRARKASKANTARPLSASKSSIAKPAAKPAVMASSAFSSATQPVAAPLSARTSLKPTAASAKKRRQRNKQAAVSQSPANGERALVSRSAAQKAAQQASKAPQKSAQKSAQKAVQKAVPKTLQKAPQKAAPTVGGSTGGSTSKRQIRRTPSRIASRRRSVGQSVVTVMPASEAHALDWAGGSLAHQMDVRPQRTASM